MANKQLELMARFMSELGLTPAARSRLNLDVTGAGDSITTISRMVYTWLPTEDDPDGAPKPHRADGTLVRLSRDIADL